MIIVFEGINHCGKSSVASEVVRKLREMTSKGASVFPWVDYFRDPGSTPLGEKLRLILKDPSTEVTPESQTLLFTACRSETAREIRKVLELNHVVVLDRWWHSTVAYQGSQGIDPAVIKRLSEIFAPLPLEPGLCFYLDVTPEEAAMRGGGSGEDNSRKDRWESKGLEFQSKLRKMYLQMVEQGHLTLVQTSGFTPDQVAKNIWSKIMWEINRWA